jgi:hypothetical protein
MLCRSLLPILKGPLGHRRDITTISDVIALAEQCDLFFYRLIIVDLHAPLGDLSHSEVAINDSKRVIDH